MSKSITIRVIVEGNGNGNGNGTGSPLVCIQDEGEILRLRKELEQSKASYNLMKRAYDVRESEWKWAADVRQQQVNDAKKELQAQQQAYQTLKEKTSLPMDTIDRLTKANHEIYESRNRVSEHVDRLKIEIEALSKIITDLRSRLGLKPGEM